MSKATVVYWLLTIVFLLPMAIGGVADVLLIDEVKQVLVHLGFPLYVGPLLGVLKILGVLALLAPGFGTLKEWAYAGFAFDLLGAVVAHAAVGDPTGQVVTPIVIAAIGAGSYVLRPEDRCPGGV